MPVFTRVNYRDLSAQESRALLVSQNVGRIAFSLHDKVDIEPINYVADGDWIFGRTSAGTKLSTLLHHPWCAFETDEIREMFDWSSVVAKGTFYLLDPEVGAADTYMRAQQLLTELVPGTFSAEDPTPRRDIVFGIFVQELTGRMARE